MAKKIDYSTPDGVQAWIRAAAFTSDREAAETLGVPFRSFCRYKAEGLPTGTLSASRASMYLVGQMQKLLTERSQK